MRESGGLLIAGLLTAAFALAQPVAASEPAPQPADAGVEDRLAPVLAYDSAERWFAQPASIAAEPRDGDRVYVHRLEADGSTWLQYWLFYAENTQDRGILRTGRHAGDWEFFQIRLGEDGKPETMTFAQHSVAERCPWDQIELEEAAGGSHPVVYVAHGSHASYPRPGTADRPWPDPNDEADGEGRRVLPGLVAIDDDHPEWIGYPGRWGGAEEGWFPGEQSSPPGPAFQADGRWRDPAAFEAAARPCGSEPPGRPWQTALTAGLVALGLTAGGAVLLRRGRPRRSL